jgi:hypothetical protein
MRFRLVVLLVASLALASVASAACLTCVPDGVHGWGYCQPTTSGWCTYTCCLWDPWTSCYVYENVYRCADVDALVVVPSAYFGTTLPMQTEGSALRLMVVKAKPVQRDCAARSIMMKKG